MKKVIYIVIVFILGIFVSYISYNSYQFSHIYGLLGEAIGSGKYEEVAKIFGGCCDTEPLLISENESVDLAVFSGTSISDVKYGEERRYQYEETYYIYLFNSSFSYITVNENENKTAFIFTSDNGNEYKYPFIVNDDINSEYYAKDDTSLEAALLKGPRNVTTNVENWGFMYLNLTKTMVEFIEGDLGGDITGIKLVNNEEEVILNENVNLDFTQGFYGYISELIVEYNKWLAAYTKNEGVDAAEKEFNEFYQPWLEKFEDEKENTGYSFPYGEDYLSPKSIIWKTAGLLTVYGLIMLGFYILFFKLDKIKAFFSNKQIKKTKTMNNSEIKENK